MFGISYDNWKDVCNMYFSLNKYSQKAYLQWFPFTKLSSLDKDEICSKSFFDKYIATSSFMFFPQTIHQSENYLQKGDGSFRDASLVSPLLYLLFQAVGKEIYDKYKLCRSENISVYYAGNYGDMHPKYKQDYDNFFKELNACIDEYQYFIKTDITNFFSNINIDKLIAQIDKVCNKESVVFSQTQLQLFKELFVYCGNGRFPLIESSMASSYLATIIYLDEIDKRFYEYLTNSVSEISDFKIVRYVDDMYILISSDESINNLNEVYNEIRNEYSSLLKEFGLALNTKKCCLKNTHEINYELKKSLYDEYFNGQKHDIEELFQDSLLEFLQDLSTELLFDSISVEKYNELIEKHFSSDDIEFTSSEVFNYLIYENNTELQSADVISEIINIVEQSISFISLDPKRLTVMIMKTDNTIAIKSFLNQLFKRYRSGKWNSYDTTIAISYLIQSKFQHRDLLSIIKEKHPELYMYYLYNCKSSFLTSFDVDRINKLQDIIKDDRKAHYLYFMHLCEKKKGNYMAAFAYYKNYFDRITADLDFEFNISYKGRKPNYKGFYKENAIISFYNNVNDSEKVIKKAHKLRNANPISHSSSDLLDNNNTSAELDECIKALSRILYQYIEDKFIC